MRCNTVYRGQAGSAAILTAALVVIVGFIGVSLTASLRTTSAGVAAQAQAVQAYYIADAGAEWTAKHGTVTATPVSFGGGTFSVTKIDDNFTVTSTLNEALCTVQTEVSPGYTPTSTGDGGIEYVLRSRVGSSSTNNVDCIIMNTSASDITFNSLRITWGSPTAYFESITFYVATGTQYGTVWDYAHEYDDYLWGSGEQDSFNRVSSVTLPAHYSAEMHFIDFESNRNGSGSNVGMGSATVRVQFFNGTTQVGDITVGLPPQ